MRQALSDLQHAIIDTLAEEPNTKLTRLKIATVLGFSAAAIDNALDGLVRKRLVSFDDISDDVDDDEEHYSLTNLGRQEVRIVGI